ncbi:hypothetical protein RchiOBHm_Chr7g0226251 [Rosa chinensis]|uniref:Uncharacterized protein n=1 Tax=Rosa chinensis TaxID=74649 RepID=A0A2P6PEB3_ROSCH|nr:hypothetical protein RchiOBHm_Chr7g0226251 [Rosa chinensis]
MEQTQQRIRETRWLLRLSLESECCCIFRVSQRLLDTSKMFNAPRIVSINGPYHNGEKHLKMMEQHKWRFLHDLFTRAPSTSWRLDDYLAWS